MRNITEVLVTGGAGFIGSHLTERLLAEGFSVKVLDNFSTGQISNLKEHQNAKLSIVQGDVRNTALVEKTVKDVDAVFHEAALIDIQLSIEEPLLFHDVNVLGTLNLLLASAKSGVKRFIFASSAAIYGDSMPSRKTENMLPAPISPYAASKLAAENYIQVFNKQYDLETVCLRYFNVYGPRQCSSSDYSGVITTFIRRLHNNERPILYGDGTQTRDFVHVSDVASANMLALKSEEAVGETINVASGISISIHELAEILLQITGKEKLEPILAEPRLGDIKHCSADISKAEELLRFHPEVALKNGLSNLIGIKS